jgi:flagellar hook-length control protein FliK
MGLNNTRGIAPATNKGSKKDSTDDMGRSFSQLFEEEAKKGLKPAEKEKESKETTLINNKNESDKDTGKATSQEKAKADAKTDEVQKKIQEEIKEKLTKMNPALNYLYNLMYKNPDALSLVEKQSAGLEKNPEFGVGLKEFNGLLKDRGMKLSDLSFNQIAKLAQCNTKSQITAFLDTLKKAEWTSAEDEKMKTSALESGKEKAAEEKTSEMASTPKPLFGEESMVNQNKQAEQQQEMQKSAQQIKREEVIDQIVKQMDVRNFGDKTELQLRLNPEYLGELKMNIVHEDGKMVAKFETTSREVRELLEESFSELNEEFGKKGLKLTGSSVKLVENID